MEFFTTKIVDQPVDSKVNLEKINNLLALSVLPENINEAAKFIVTIVAREPNDFEFDAWKRNGKIYLTIPLFYEDVLEETEEVITERCGTLFGNYIKDLKIS